jgi:hypothetical protein
MEWCHDISNVPKGPHYAILEQRSISIPGDERSRTNPGHGYPASTEQVWDYIVFKDRNEWENEIKRRSGLVFGNRNFIPISVTPATITTSISVDVK